jgi:hypothetical protein
VGSGDGFSTRVKLVHRGDAEVAEFKTKEPAMIRILFVAVMVASGTVAFAHEGKECKCRQVDETHSFREQALSDLHPLTREVLKTMLLADECGTGHLHDYRVVPGIGLRIIVPPMGPTPIKLDFEMPRLETPPRENQPLPNHLAVS